MSNETVSDDKEGNEDIWYLGSMNDGLFIINKRPHPSTDHINHSGVDGPTVVLNITELPSDKAQKVINTHNTTLNKKDEQIRRLKADLDLNVKMHAITVGEYEKHRKTTRDKDRIAEAVARLHEVLSDTRTEVEAAGYARGIEDAARYVGGCGMGQNGWLMAAAIRALSAGREGK